MNAYFDYTCSLCIMLEPHYERSLSTGQVEESPLMKKLRERSKRGTLSLCCGELP